jgi:hypothetical protein
MSRDEQIERALHQALTCREDRKRAEAALEALRRKETACHRTVGIAGARG